MKWPVLTLTRSKQISAICWCILLLCGVLANQFPVETFPAPLRSVAVVLAVVLATVLIFVTFGFRVEKGDERSVENERRTNSTLFILIFLALGALLVWMRSDQTITLGEREVLFLFGGICLAQDILFLLYERFGA